MVLQVFLAGTAQMNQTPRIHLSALQPTSKNTKARRLSSEWQIKFEGTAEFLQELE